MIDSRQAKKYRAEGDISKDCTANSNCLLAEIVDQSQSLRSVHAVRNPYGVGSGTIECQEHKHFNIVEKMFELWWT